jgi:hypothetical protein
VEEEVEVEVKADRKSNWLDNGFNDFLVLLMIFMCCCVG